MHQCRLEDLDSSKRKKHMTLDAQNFSERDRVSLRTDLLDARVYICTPDVLMLFSDNFDYQVGCPKRILHDHAFVAHQSNPTYHVKVFK